MPSPPVGVDPVNAAGVVPVHIDCADKTVLFEITGLTVTATSSDAVNPFPSVIVTVYVPAVDTEIEEVVSFPGLHK